MGVSDINSLLEDIKSVDKIVHNGKSAYQVKYLDETIFPNYDDWTGAPGAKKLIAGDMNAGFFGEVPSEDFISGDEITKLAFGATNGYSKNLQEPWLKFAYKGKVQFIAKKVVRGRVSYQELLERNLVYGDKTFVERGLKYKIRLIKGVADGVDPRDNSLGAEAAHYSEWNQLMLPIHEQAPDKWEKPEFVESDLKSWNVNYTDADLETAFYQNDNKPTKPGLGALCQDMVVRGVQCPESLRITDKSETEIGTVVKMLTGWRPVLEVVS